MAKFLDYEIMEPEEMVPFLNELASKTEDEDIRWKLTQCSIFIHVIVSEHN